MSLIQTFWITTGVVAVGTLLIRASFVVGMGTQEPPALLQRCLRYVPAAVLAALMTPAILIQDDRLAAPWSNPYLFAALIAGFIAWRTRNTILTIVVGMVALWVLRAL